MMPAHLLKVENVDQWGPATDRRENEQETPPYPRLKIEQVFIISQLLQAIPLVCNHHVATNARSPKDCMRSCSAPMQQQQKSAQ